MALNSMKVGGDNCAPCGEHEYGFGLCISLNDQQTEALGVKKPLEAGTVVQITALAYVQTISQSADGAGEGDDATVRMSLQITDMEITPAKAKKTSDEVGASLYGAK